MIFSIDLVNDTSRPFFDSVSLPTLVIHVFHYQTFIVYLLLHAIRLLSSRLLTMYLSWLINPI